MNINDHWKTDFIVDKYHTPRSWDQLFASERYFLKKICVPGMRVLDVGCATGGLYHGLQEHYGEIDYVGVDISEPLIKRAKELAPDATFVLGDMFGEHREIQKNSFDLVVATGIFQHEPQYERLLGTMIEYAKEGGYVLFDVKLFHTHSTIVDINRAYGDHGDHKVYYNIFNIKRFVQEFKNQNNIDKHVELYGYYAGVNDTVHLPDSVDEEVCSAHVLLTKNSTGHDELDFELQLPEGFNTV